MSEEVLVDLKVDWSKKYFGKYKEDLPPNLIKIVEDLLKHFKEDILDLYYKRYYKGKRRVEKNTFVV